MNERLERLDALWRLEQPPAPDPAFSYAVMARIERHRLWSGLGDSVLLTLAIGLLAWMLAPTVDDLTRLADAPLMLAAAFVAGLSLFSRPELAG